MTRSSTKVATAALHALGEKSTSSRHHLWVRDGLGMGLQSSSDRRVQRLIVEALSDLEREGPVRNAWLGAAEMYAHSRLTTLPWGRPRHLTPAGMAAGDGSLPERVHMALSSLSWTILPKSIPTRGPRTPDMPAGRSPDGGRYADYRLADILSPKLLEATHC